MRQGLKTKNEEIQQLRQELVTREIQLTEARRRTIPLKDVKGLNGSLNFLPGFIISATPLTPFEQKTSATGEVIAILGPAEITLTVIGEVVQTI